MNQKRKEPMAETKPLTAGDRAERIMRRRITRLSLLVMVLLPALVCFGLRALETYVNNDLAVFYPSTMMTALQWILYYLSMVLMAVYQFAGYGVIGYSVLRYGVKRSVVPMILSIVSAAITYAGSIMDMIYVYGSHAVLENLSYLGVQWIVNFFLSLFTTLCVIFLCAMLRISFVRSGRLAVGITKEDRAAKQKNVLRRLYLYISLMLLAFNLVSRGMTTFVEIRRVGLPGNFWDFFTLVEPYIGLLLASALGFYVQCGIGAILTGDNAAAKEHVLAQGQLQKDAE